jgi:imidazole glycerol-phosphate synthase subunit HisF
MYHNASKHLMDRATALRQRETKAEQAFWKMVRENQIKGYKFRRQHALSCYVVDFYCHKLQLVIELDGSIHDLEEIIEKDITRQKAIESLGLRVYRFSNSDVLEHPSKVIQRLLQIIEDFELAASIRKT